MGCVPPTRTNSSAAWKTMICMSFKNPLPPDICTAVATALHDAKLNIACNRTQTGYRGAGFEKKCLQYWAYV